MILTILNYLFALKIASFSFKKYTKKILFIVAILINISVLYFFKYLNFVNDLINAILIFFKIHSDIKIMNIIAPLGISYITFKNLSYIIDVYRDKKIVEKSIQRYALYISFFPSIAAGPIDRSKNFLPQLTNQKRIRYESFSKGLKLILIGFFQKIVIADRLAIYVNSVYNNIEYHNGSTLLIATIFFSFQIYSDFAGYSNIAIGTAKLFGINLTINFNRPYLARSISEFWQRWHISLSTWLRDYLFLPIAYSVLRKIKSDRIGNIRIESISYATGILITWFLAGIWHGAGFTFIIWGMLHGSFLLVSHITSKSRKRMRRKLRLKKLFPVPYTLFQISITFLLVSFTWIFFRANCIDDALLIINKIVHLSDPFFLGNPSIFFYSLSGISILIVVELKNEFFSKKFSLFNNDNVIVRYASYCLIFSLILAIGVFDNSQFIYFQF